MWKIFLPNILKLASYLKSTYMLSNLSYISYVVAWAATLNIRESG